MFLSHIDVFLSLLKKKKKNSSTLAGMAQWIECGPVDQRLPVGFPVQGTCLGYGPGSQLGEARGNHTRFSPSVSLSLPLSKK